MANLLYSNGVPVSGGANTVNTIDYSIWKNMTDEQKAVSGLVSVTNYPNATSVDELANEIEQLNQTLANKFTVIHSEINSTSSTLIPYPNGYSLDNSGLIGIMCHTIYGSWVNSDYDNGQYGVDLMKTIDGYMVTAKTNNCDKIELILTKTV